MTIDRPLVLLWINDPAPYRQALARAGLEQRTEIVHVPLTETPGPDLLARGRSLLRYSVRGGVDAKSRGRISIALAESAAQEKGN